jgi:hypothetical protein
LSQVAIVHCFDIGAKVDDPETRAAGSQLHLIFRDRDARLRRSAGCCEVGAFSLATH